MCKVSLLFPVYFVAVCTDHLTAYFLGSMNINCCYPNLYLNHMTLCLHLSSTPVPATIIVSPMDTTVVSPNPAVFTCEADGVSIPVITWWRRESSNSLTQLSSDDLNVTISDRNLDSRTRQSNLTILQPLPVDAAEYVCRATNEIGSDTASIILIVHGKCNSSVV